MKRWAAVLLSVCVLWQGGVCVLAADAGGEALPPPAAQGDAAPPSGPEESAPEVETPESAAPEAEAPGSALPEPAAPESESAAPGTSESAAPDSALPPEAGAAVPPAAEAAPPEPAGQGAQPPPEATVAPAAGENLELYHPGDVQIVNALITSTGLQGYALNDPYGWYGLVTWVPFIKPYRVQKLTLSLNRNAAGTVDLRGLTELEYFGCSTTNSLTGLNASGLPKLKEVHCHHNQLSFLDVSGSTSLEVLGCSNNQLTSLNVAGLTKLKKLDCEGNQLAALDASGCVALEQLDCRNNRLAALRVASSSPLESLDCSGNQLTGLDLSGLARLKEADCSNNKLASLNVAGAAALEELRCSDNQLPALNLSGLGELYSLACRNNRLAGLDVSGSAKLNYLSCSGNQLTGLNISGVKSLRYLYCENNRLTALDLRDMAVPLQIAHYDNPMARLSLPGGATLAVKQPKSGQIRSVRVSSAEYYDYREIALQYIPGVRGKLRWVFSSPVSFLGGTGTASNPVAFRLSAGTTVSADTGEDAAPAPKPPTSAAAVTQVKFPQGAVRLLLKRSISLPAMAYTRDGSKARLAYSSANPKIATVSAGGKITARAAGTTVITAKAAGGKSARLRVTVLKQGGKPVKVTRVSASVPKTLRAGQKKSIVGKYSPARATGVRLTYLSSKKSVATIDRYGMLHARKKGSAVITVKCGRVSRRYRITVV